MLLRRRKSAKMGTRPETGRCASHLKFVRGFACLCLVHGDCSGKIEAHHVRGDGNAGMGMKPDDAWAVPLCAHHHQLGHAIGWQTFQQRYSIDLAKWAEKIARVSPHLRKLSP